MRPFAALPLLVISLTLVGVLGVAHASGDQRGPTPTMQTLEADKGPYPVASAKVASPSGYGSATVYFPTVKTEGSFGLVVFCPGFVSVQNYYAWLAERVASHGFVVVNMGTNAIFDTPAKRTPQLLSALKQVVALSQSGATAYSGVVDTNRLALMGHSAGGGGALEAASATPTLKAVVALNPAHTLKGFSALQVPALVLAAQNDTIAPSATYARPFYDSLDVGLTSAYIELAGANHLSATFLGTASAKAKVAKYTIAWLKRFVDSDARYAPFLKGGLAEQSGYAARGVD